NQYAELSPAEMLEKLQSRDNTVALQSLKALERGYDLREVPMLTLERLLGHPHPQIRRQALHLFRSRDIDGYKQEVARLLEDPNVEVRLEAARYLYHFYDAESYDGDWLMLLKQGLAHGDLHIRATTLGVIVKDGGDQERALITDELLEEGLQYSGEGAKELRVVVARAVSINYTESRSSTLEKLLEDRSQEVISQAIISAGYTGDRQFVPVLLNLFEKRKYKKKIQKGLAIYGRRILGTLFDYMTDEQGKLSRQVKIPQVLYHNHSQEALEVLQLALEESSIPVRHQIIKALNKIRQKIENPLFNKEKLKNNVYQEARRYALLNQSLMLLANSSPRELSNIMEEE